VVTGLVGVEFVGYGHVSDHSKTLLSSYSPGLHFRQRFQPLFCGLFVGTNPNFRQLPALPTNDICRIVGTSSEVAPSADKYTAKIAVKRLSEVHVTGA
jgi:hypothetical protein